MELAEARELPEEPGRNMVFHRVLCYFLLWVCVAGHLLSALQCFTGPEMLSNPACDVLMGDVLALDDNLRENVAEPFFTLNVSRQLPRGKDGRAADEVTGTLGKILLLSAADGAVCASLPAVLGMSVTGSFICDGILHILLAITEAAAALLLTRRKRLGALLVQLSYLAQTVLLIVLMFPHLSFPYLTSMFVSLLMAGFTTVYYVRRRHQMTYMGEAEEPEKKAEEMKA